MDCLTFSFPQFLLSLQPGKFDYVCILLPLGTSHIITALCPSVHADMWDVSRDGAAAIDGRM